MQPPEPPVPLAAVWSALPQQVAVTFDQPLVAGAIAPANWSARHANQLYDGIAPAAVAGAVATVRMNAVGAQIAPDIVNYLATPPDVVSAGTGETVRPFAAFPIT